MFPKAQLGVGPVIENGFFYDFLLPRPVTPEDIKKLEKRMRALAQQKLKFERVEMSMAEAKEYFESRRQPFKVELIKDIEKFGTTKADEKLNAESGIMNQELGTTSKTEKVSLYKTGNFVDLCRGGHVENTSQIRTDAFKLDKVSGAYWRGDQKNPQMQRIYGIAFETKMELEKYQKMQEEAKKRDHRILGKQLDLFTFSELVGAGLPLWTPRGTLLRNLLDDYVWQLRKQAGFVKVEIPHITKKGLYETSGHWAKFKNELFRIETREGHEFAMKPMNCPHHIEIFKRKLHSYRDLPQRYANTTMVYRDEQTGELNGLSRVRCITQDDAHVFCRYSQIRQEILELWDVITKFYKASGKFKMRIRLSFYDPKQSQNYLGDKVIWEKAQEELKKAIMVKKVKFEEAVGEAAFYGPKIDFMANDSMGREWQLATIQLDMNLPEQFDLTCVNEKGELERIAMLHCAVMGSIERYLSILIEHLAGYFPLWLSPVQVAVLPISKKQNAYAKKMMKELSSVEPDLRIELDDRDESVGKKIREATLQKIPYQIILGEKEVKAKKIAVRTRKGKDLGTIGLKKFLDKITEEIANKK